MFDLLGFFMAWSVFGILYIYIVEGTEETAIGEALQLFIGGPVVWLFALIVLLNKKIF